MKKTKLKLPDEVKVRNETYRILKAKGVLLDDPECVGYCDPEHRVIAINVEQTEKQQLRTFIHEILHALSDEFNIDIKHKSIYKLEKAIYRFIKDNF